MPTTRQVTRSVVVAAPAGRVWEAVADPGTLARWLGVDLDVDLSPGARGRAAEDGEPREVVVEAVEPPRRLAFSWWPDGAGPAAGSSVEIHVAPADEGTRVSVHERALADAEPPLASAGSAGGAAR